MIQLLKEIFKRKPKWTWTRRSYNDASWRSTYGNMEAEIDHIPSGYRLVMYDFTFKKAYIYPDLKTAKKKANKKLLAQEL